PYLSRCAPVSRSTGDEAAENRTAVADIIRSGRYTAQRGQGGGVRTEEPLIPKHGGYRKLKSFQLAQLVYDVTVRFCERYVDRRSRTRDQMVQAARSGVQNIA